MIGVVLRTLLVLAIAALVGTAAYVFSSRQPEQYNSTVRLEFGGSLPPELQVIGADFGGGPDVDEEIRISTEAAGLNSFDVARSTARVVPELGLDAGAIAARINAEPSRGTLTIALNATGTSPQRAERLARAYVNEYLSRERVGERRRAKRVQDALETRLAGLKRADARGPIGAALRDQISTLRVFQNVGSGSPRIIERAQASRSPSQPKTVRNVLFGVLFGLVVGIGLVALRTETRARTAASIGRRSGMRAKGEPVQRR